METHPKLSAARVLVSRKEPYLSAALWRMTLSAVKDWPKDAPGEICTDAKGRCLASLALVERATPEQLAGAIAHEIGHLVRQHGPRRGSRDPMAWNCAGDATINPDVLDIWPLPDFTPEQVAKGAKYIMPTEFGLPRGKTADEYYAAFPELEKSRSKGKPGQGSGQGEKSCGSCAGQKHPAEDLLPQGDGSGQGDGQGEPGENPGNSGQNGSDAADWSATAAQTAHAIRQQAKARGNVPGGWAVWAEAYLEGPKPDWRKVLAAEVRGVLRASGAKDYTYTRPSRRACVTRAILPVLRSPVLRAAIVDDTSGSMDSPEIIAAQLRDVDGILKAAGCREVRYIACDTIVHSDVTVRNVAAIKAHRKGGGGTALEHGIARAATRDKNGETADVCVVLTDGYSSWPTRAPKGMRVIIRVPEKGPTTPSWARRVEFS